MVFHLPKLDRLNSLLGFQRNLTTRNWVLVILVTASTHRRWPDGLPVTLLARMEELIFTLMLGKTR